MTKVMVEPSIEALLGDWKQPVEICNSEGKPLGVFCPTGTANGKQTGKVRSRYSHEELEQLRQVRSGCTLEEIWQRLTQMGIPVRQT